MVDSHKSLSVATDKDLNRSIARLKEVIGFFAILALLLGIGITIYLSKSISGRLSGMEDATHTSDPLLVYIDAADSRLKIPDNKAIWFSLNISKKIQSRSLMANVGQRFLGFRFESEIKDPRRTILICPASRSARPTCLWGGKSKASAPRVKTMATMHSAVKEGL